MKKSIIFLFSILLLISACDDKLDLTPYNGLTDEQLFSSDKGFSDAVKGVYSNFRNDGLYGENTGLLISPEVLSDNLIMCQAGRQTLRPLHEWWNTANDNGVGVYTVGYRGISRANRVLDNLDKLPEGTFKNNIEGEALALRALLHFEIARVYCKIPTQSADANSSMGIYYAKKFEPSLVYRRLGTTVSGTYNDIIADLTRSYELIGLSNGVGRLKKAAVAGLIARVQLFNGNYQQVVNYADSSIKYGAIVAPRTEFANIWADTYNGNILFKIRVIDADRWRPGVPFSQTSASSGTRSEYVCAYDLYQLFQASDVRLGASIITSNYAGRPYNHVRKFMGRPIGNATVVDGKYLRSEEVYLSKAEALYRLSREADALTALNEVRSRRYSSFTSPDETGVALFNAIMLERRIEFAFEGDRWYTLKRLGLGLNRGNFGDRGDGTGTTPILLTYAADGFRWQQPLPQVAIDANPILFEDQNPGY
ncbi:MAG: RagB/SusD family nutrient uptake outer membrane protein [Tenuifilaceae bacterium]